MDGTLASVDQTIARILWSISNPIATAALAVLVAEVAVRIATGAWPMLWLTSHL